MGIYIKGMQMPVSCMECPLYNGFGCKATYQMFRPQTNIAVRASNCPLVKVSVPHGRLIDADALADDLEHDASRFDDEHEMKFNCAGWLRSNRNHTVIEAETEKNLC